MSSNNDTKDIIISKAFDKWADKKWFQVVCAIFFFYLLLAPIAGPFVYNYINKTNTSVAVTESLDERDSRLKEEHRINFEKSKQCYALAKTIMKNYQEEIDCDYMFLIEYHNGTENVMNSIQFCRFDITIEVNRTGIPFVNLDKFKDDIVARYDLLLSEELANSKGVLKYDEKQIESMDLYLAQHLKVINAKTFAIINILNEDKKVCSSLVCVSKTDSMNISQIYQCERELENLFKNTL